MQPTRNLSLFATMPTVCSRFTLENVRTMCLEVIGYGQELYAKKWALRAAVLAAATPEELEALHWGNAI